MYQKHIKNGSTMIRNQLTNILTIALLIASSTVIRAQNNLDLFNYHGTVTTSNGLNDYGPKDWSKVRCSDLDSCVSDFLRTFSGR
jgi:hypothetical protein